MPTLSLPPLPPLPTTAASAPSHWVAQLADLPAVYHPLLTTAAQQYYEFGGAWWQLMITHGLTASESAQVWFQQYSASPTGLALLPLCIDSSTTQARSLTNCYTTLYAPLIAEPAGVTALTQLLRALRTSARPATLTLRPLAQESLPTLHASLRAAGWWTFDFLCFYNWYLPTAELDYTTYYQARPAALRHTLERKLKKLQRSHHSEFTIVTGGSALENAIAAYTQIYAASWKQPEPFLHFIPALIRQLAEHGQLRLGVAWIDGTPAAAQLWMVTEHRAAICKLAYDSRFAAFSIGSLLTAHLMHHVIAVDRVHEVDYLIGNDAYKRDWMTHCRSRWGILACNPNRMRGVGMAGREALWRFIKHQLRS